MQTIKKGDRIKGNNIYSGELVEGIFQWWVSSKDDVAVIGCGIGELDLCIINNVQLVNPKPLLTII